MQAKSFRRPPASRVVRASKLQQAAEAIGDITPGCEIFVFTFGQFSLVDAIDALLRQTGPADLTLATWTAGQDSIERAHTMLANAEIRRLRMIVDRGFIEYVPEKCRALRELFGDGCIRSAATHAKWAAISNESWSLAVRTSMNLSHNPRLDNIEVSDDPALCGFFEKVADELFAEQPPGQLKRDMPTLPGLDWLPAPSVAAGRVDRGDLKTVKTGHTSSSTP